MGFFDLRAGQPRALKSFAVRPADNLVAGGDNEVVHGKVRRQAFSGGVDGSARGYGPQHAVFLQLAQGPGILA